MPSRSATFLERLTAAGEGLERYLHTKYMGQKRFSGEGDTIIRCSITCCARRCGRRAGDGDRHGAPRSSPGVLVNTFGKLPKDLFAEFEGKYDTTLSAAGDVKYHKGFSSDITTPGGPMHITLAFNPSHLEIVEDGGDRIGARPPESSWRQEWPRSARHPVAWRRAVAGRGVVQETLALSQTRHYGTGGAMHR